MWYETTKSKTASFCLFKKIRTVQARLKNQRVLYKESVYSKIVAIQVACQFFKV